VSFVVCHHKVYIDIVDPDVDDAAGLAHRRAGQHGAMHVERAGEINGDELLPLSRLGLDERAEHVPPGVVDQHVEVPKTAKTVQPSP
jgi:hypothetical protein